MANVIIKSEERREAEAFVARSFGVGTGATGEQREAVETIARRSEEAAAQARRMEERR